MTSEERLWLNGFAAVGLALAEDELAIEEVSQAVEEDLTSDQAWMAPWMAGLNAGIRAGFGS